MVRAGFLIAWTTLSMGCAETSTPTGSEGGLSARVGGQAKPTSGPSVTAADPSFGYEGEVNKTVTINGSGFTTGAVAAWERNGVPDSKIQVLAMQYMSSTKLVATITIAADASIDLYDISVTNPDKKKGIGYALFQVTQAIAVQGTSIFRGTNSSGEFAGVLIGSGGNQHTAYYYNAGTSSLAQLSTNGAGWGIAESGTTISGNTNGGGSLPIPIWNLVGGSWVMGTLPVASTATGGAARVIISDPLTGAALYVGGSESVACKPNCVSGNAVIWRQGPGGWERLQLPSLGIGARYVEAVSAGGVAVGASGGHAAVWTPDGLGGYTVAALPGGATVAHGITSAGDLIVGGVSSNPNSGFYWALLPGGGWSAAQSLPLACGEAIDVDDAGRIVANGCPKTSKVSLPAVFTPPYATTVPIWLGGFQTNTPPIVEAMSRRNGWIVGKGAPNGTSEVGVYWKIY
jgi:hypothetical protein